MKWLKEASLIEWTIFLSIIGLLIFLISVLATGKRYQVINIGGCQYIHDRIDSSVPLVHASNCTNAVHVYRLEK